MITYLKKNKVSLLLPLVLIPFLFLIFYILGGGKQNAGKGNENQTQTNGANYILPEAEKSIEIMDKMEAYQNENTASASLSENPSFQLDSTNIKLDIHDVQADSLKRQLRNQSRSEVSGQLMAHVREKEARIRKENQEEKKVVSTPIKYKASPKKPNAQQAVIHAIKEQEKEWDEMEKMLSQNVNLSRENDSLQYHLKETKEQLKELSQKQEQRFTLEKKEVNGFDREKSFSSLIRAEVCEQTTVLDGNRIKMRLLEEVCIDGKKIAKHTFFYGICKIDQERLNIQVVSFPMEGHFLPVDLRILDLDGLPGLYIPDNVARKVSKEIGSRTNLSPLWSISSDPITGIGINTADRTAQALIKRVKLRKITIKQNTLLYLINQK